MTVCAKCGGAGSYAYDENHGKVCEACCPHDLGWWLLEEHYGEHNGRYACRRGCGTTIARGGEDAGQAIAPPDDVLDRLAPDLRAWLIDEVGAERCDVSLWLRLPSGARMIISDVEAGDVPTIDDWLVGLYLGADDGEPSVTFSSASDQSRLTLRQAVLAGRAIITTVGPAERGDGREVLS